MASNKAVRDLGVERVEGVVLARGRGENISRPTRAYPLGMYSICGSG